MVLADAAVVVADDVAGDVDDVVADAASICVTSVCVDSVSCACVRVWAPPAHKSNACWTSRLFKLVSNRF